MRYRHLFILLAHLTLVACGEKIVIKSPAYSLRMRQLTAQMAAWVPSQWRQAR